MSTLSDRYLACWNADDPQERIRLATELFAPNARYVDPLIDARGLEELLTTIAAVREQFPGFVFTPVGDTEQHHQIARFRWGPGPADAEPVIVGADVVQLSADGRIDSVLGFLDRVPA